MLVTEVISLDKRRSKVLTDGNFAFALYKGELRKYHIEEGAELSEERYGEIEAVLRRRAKEQALYYLKRQDRTEMEVARKLRDGVYPETIVQHTLEFLREYRLVDDMEYGRRYIERYGSCRSRRWIQSSLAKKGLDREQIEQLLSQGQVTEDDQILAYLQKKGYDAASAEPKERAKILASLLRRGYSYGAVCRIMEATGHWG